MHPKDECVFIFRDGDAWVLTFTHVDDIFVLANAKGHSLRDKIKSELGKHMTVEDKDPDSALDTKIERDAGAGVLKISQRAYIESLLAEFRVADSEGVDIPMSPGFKTEENDLLKTEEEKKELENFAHYSAIGSLWWIASVSRPDICMATHYALGLHLPPQRLSAMDLFKTVNKISGCGNFCK